jgi:hypothetical protein
MTDNFGGLHFTKGVSDDCTSESYDRVGRAYRRLVAIYGSTDITLVPDAQPGTQTLAGAGTSASASPTPAPKAPVPAASPAAAHAAPPPAKAHAAPAGKKK